MNGDKTLFTIHFVLALEQAILLAITEPSISTNINLEEQSIHL